MKKYKKPYCTLFFMNPLLYCPNLPPPPSATTSPALSSRYYIAGAMCPVWVINWCMFIYTESQWVRGWGLGGALHSASRPGGGVGVDPPADWHCVKRYSAHHHTHPCSIWASSSTVTHAPANASPRTVGKYFIARQSRHTHRSGAPLPRTTVKVVHNGAARASLLLKTRKNRIISE